MRTRSSRPRLRTVLLALLGLSLITTTLIGRLPAAYAASAYYVSPTGNDSNSGLSPTQAWKTITKVNGAVFSAGSSVAFQGGATFTGCLAFNPTNVPNSSATAPFRVTSYGSGQATITSNCTGTYSAAVSADHVNGFTVDNLKIVNGGSTAAGVLLQNQQATTPTRGLTIQNSKITGFFQTGTESVFGGQIAILGYAVNGNSGPLAGIKIIDNHLYGASKTSKAGAGIYGWGSGTNITDVLVERNIVDNLGMAAKTTGGAITANGWDGAVIQHNRVHDIGANVTSCGGTSGILAYTSKNVQVRFNEVYAVEPVPSLPAGSCDWDGIDLDGGVSNSVVEYNYTHDNAGSGLLAYVDTPGGMAWGPNTFRYNISQNDDRLKAQGGLMNVVPKAPPNALSIYGNTFYTNVAQTTKSTASACFFFGYASGTWAAGSQIRNNICALENRDQYGRAGEFSYNPNGHTGMALSNNLYWSTRTATWRWGGTTYPDFAAWQASGKETNAKWGNPLFASPGNGGNCVPTPLPTGPQPCPAAYRLQSGSPALGAGVPITGSGGKDYYQDPLANPPHIGADGG